MIIRLAATVSYQIRQEARGTTKHPKHDADNVLALFLTGFVESATISFPLLA